MIAPPDFPEKTMSLIPLQPLQDRVIVKRIEEDKDKKIGNMYVPDAAKEKPQEGVVLAVGQGFVTPAGTVLPIGVFEGDTVLFGKYSGNEVQIEINGIYETVLILKAEEIMAVRTA
jgi:chaperonin GroES